MSVVWLWLAVTAAGPVNLARDARVEADSTYGEYLPAKAVDGVVSDESRWVSGDGPGSRWLIIRLAAPVELGGAHVYSGWQTDSQVAGFVFEAEIDGAWREIPSSRIIGNTALALAVPFDEPIRTAAVRFQATDTGRVRIREITLWPWSKEGLPPLGTGVEQKVPAAPAAASPDPPRPSIYLNQSGFNYGAPKRFTAPSLPEGTPFEIRAVGRDDALYTGRMAGAIGDFTSFEPRDEREYVVTAGGLSSVPFRIGPWWLERVTYQRAVDFMIDSRHYVGNYTAPCAGSFGWRDDHHFAFELNTLVPQYLSNPAAYERMPRQVTYVKPRPGLWGALEPYDEAAPDIVKLIHWGADVIVTQGATHELLKSQLAWFLAAWPNLARWLPEQNRRVVADFVRRHWTSSTADRKYPYDGSDDHNLLALKTKIGSTKGELPPGFSVLPNLLLDEVARRDGWPNPEPYFAAALAQTQWLIANLDWDDPLTTKGQRMSEHVTLTGLAWFAERYPDRAPAGLREKIIAWAEVAVRRADNLWDFRKLTDGEQWTPTGPAPTMWNEPGNVVGFPACALAALSHLPAGPLRERLQVLVWAHLDNAFGRNPCGRHFSYDAPREIEGVEYGWYSFYKGGIGQLAGARFVLDGAPKNEHYPYHPEVGNVGWTEGWVNFNTAFNLSLAYLARQATRLELTRVGDRVRVTLTAPLNFDYGRPEPVTLTIRTSTGDEEQVTLVEPEALATSHVGELPLGDGPVQAGDGRLQLAPGATAEVSYGGGAWTHTARLRG